MACTARTRFRPPCRVRATSFACSQATQFRAARLNVGPLPDDPDGCRDQPLRRLRSAAPKDEDGCYEEEHSLLLESMPHDRHP